MTWAIVLGVLVVACLIGAIYTGGKTAALLFVVFLVVLVLFANKLLILTGNSLVAGARNDVNVAVNSDNVFQEIYTFVDSLLYEVKIRLGTWW